MLSVRTSNELHVKLQGALRESGRTLTQEVEMRLERSFQHDDFVGGERNAAFLGLLGASIREVESARKASWLADRNAWVDVSKVITRLIEERRPTDAQNPRGGAASDNPASPKPRIKLFGPQFGESNGD